MTSGLESLRSSLREGNKPSPPAVSAETIERAFRGIAPPLLIEQVRNTTPFLWSQELPVEWNHAHLRYLRFLGKETLSGWSAFSEISSYFYLCLCAHHATVATFVPTDVDVHIRFKLWKSVELASDIESMAQTVLESLHWDSSLVSVRSVESPISGEAVSGHHGEWFSTAAAAYAACMSWRLTDLQELVEKNIRIELIRESQIFLDLVSQKLGKEIVKATYLLAHNVGDLLRVLEQWEVRPETDPLAAFIDGYCQSEPFSTIARLNRDYASVENHRHFALRVPRALRRHRELLLPIGPFFDDWGAKLAQFKKITDEERGSILEALIQGWERLPNTTGYARALKGFEESVPGGMNKAVSLIPARSARLWRAGPLRQLCSIGKHAFERQWEQRGIHHTQDLRSGLKKVQNTFLHSPNH